MYLAVCANFIKFDQIKCGHYEIPHKRIDLLLFGNIPDGRL